MILKSLFSRIHVPVLKRSLDAASLRQTTIASNLANIETPNYRRKEVVFESELQKALDPEKLSGVVTNPKHIQIGRTDLNNVQPKVIVDKTRTKASGVNNVDVDQEISSLAKNQLYYAFSAKLISIQFNRIKEAINERTR
ncbi:MAG: flagellar basal body rod protein FlgB [Calditrichaeota bacterium]|nr:flagellar basal body rod protein FlgB [Calditrichota bacterium]